MATTKAKKAARHNLIVRIDLADTEPPIWRRVRVPSNIKLSRLHEVIQIVMDWQNCHLHQFVFKARYFMPPYPDGEFDDFRDVEDERKITLGELLTRKGARLIYEYDFGDSWQHVLKLEETQDADGAKAVELLDGELAGPPEDCGGIPGYYNLLDALSDPKHPDHDDLKEWCGGFDAESFDIAATNRLLKRHCK